MIIYYDIWCFRLYGVVRLPQAHDPGTTDGSSLKHAVDIGDDEPPKTNRTDLVHHDNDSSDCIYISDNTCEHWLWLLVIVKHRIHVWVLVQSC